MSNYLIICKVSGETYLNLNDANTNQYKTINVKNNSDIIIVSDANVVTQPKADQSESQSNNVDTNTGENTDDKVAHVSHTTTEKAKSVDRKYYITSKIGGKLWHLCKYPDSRCDYKTIWSNAMVNHIRSHTGHKPYACDYPDCSSRFAISCNLKNHMKIHSNSRLSTKNRPNYHRVGRKKKRRSAYKRIVPNITSNDRNLTENINSDILSNKHNSNANVSDIYDFNDSQVVNESSSSLSSLVNQRKNCLNKMPARKSIFLLSAKKSISGSSFSIDQRNMIEKKVIPDNTRNLNKFEVKRSNQLSNISQSLLEVDNSLNNLNSSPLLSPVRPVNQSVSNKCSLNDYSVNDNLYGFQNAIGDDMPSDSIGIKGISSYLKTTKRNGKLWRICQFPDCSYGSNLTSSLIHHIRCHLNDRPYKCPYKDCDKAFTIKTNLNNHIKVHKGIRKIV